MENSKVSERQKLTQPHEEGRAKPSQFKTILRALGPGFVTGASDDDPSGIATYTQAGALFALGLLWTALLTFPLMVSIQEMCGRIGLVTSQGIAGVLKRHYPKFILYLVLAVIVPANAINIGADLAGMGAVAHLIFPAVPKFAFMVFFTVFIPAVTVFASYRRFALFAQLLALILVVYLILPFLVPQDWKATLAATILPRIEWNKEYIATLVAILGTTISPYLFFWQASMEVEDRNMRRRLHLSKGPNTEIKDMRLDVAVGMFWSNAVMFFIILTAGTTLHRSGITQVETVEQAAQALRPLAGRWAYLLFATGVIGTGLLAIPVLAGSSSYVMAEAFGWPQGIDRKFNKARSFYGFLVLSIVIGLLINFLGVSPVKALIWTATLYGIISPLLIGVVLHICNNEKVMGGRKNGPLANIFGMITLVLMTLAVAGFFFTSL